MKIRRRAPISRRHTWRHLLACRSRHRGPEVSEASCLPQPRGHQTAVVLGIGAPLASICFLSVKGVYGGPT